ncbi:hypothetical protein KQI86_00985 [Clostridium sp. MSJ-11]|uniref:YxlC n=1 Tax=Clostridium mobile TaxID=2841512 RepID=A0ABS6ECW5_9CLOT|nr:hypothetical protein [Clostridium mobile]MBU5482878.1 hypothetical protein [Clostridium mobile]
MNNNKDFENMKEFMDILTNDNFDISLNIEEIVKKGMEIKERRNRIKDNLIFVFLAFGILLGLFSLTFIWGIEFIIYFQVAIMILAPLIVLPITRNLFLREDRS